MTYISVIPALRTVPGVEQFDYAVEDASRVAPGDLILVPFRKKVLPALVVEIKNQSPYQNKIVILPDADPILRFGKTAVILLELTAAHLFVSKPSILHSWLRQVPKRLKPFTVEHATVKTQLRLEPDVTTRYLVDRLGANSGLISEAKRRNSKTLVLTPWQHEAQKIAACLGCPALTAETSSGQAWKSVSSFISGDLNLLVATRLGAWLSLAADRVLLDEPENDDYKQDELSPRFDARWIVQTCASLRPELSVISFSVTPPLQNISDAPKAPDIDLEVNLEHKTMNARSEIDCLGPRALQAIEESLDLQTPVMVLHPVRGQRSGLICRDCGWRAVCASCGFSLGMAPSSAWCKKCGQKSELPQTCPSCGGADLTRGMPGKDRVREQLEKCLEMSQLSVADLAEFNRLDFPKNGHLVITDLSLIGGVTEDIRRRERLIISWRRLAAKVKTAGGKITIQSSDEILDHCRDWLTSHGLQNVWQQELKERKIFSYPPVSHLVKIIISGDQSVAERIKQNLKSVIPAEAGIQVSQDYRMDSRFHGNDESKNHIEIRGPYPVAFRPKASLERHILHLVAPLAFDLNKLSPVLNDLKKQAIIDLDPTAFFS